MGSSKYTLLVGVWVYAYIYVLVQYRQLYRYYGTVDLYTVARVYYRYSCIRSSYGTVGTAVLVPKVQYDTSTDTVLKYRTVE